LSNGRYSEYIIVLNKEGAMQRIQSAIKLSLAVLLVSGLSILLPGCFELPLPDGPTGAVTSEVIRTDESGTVEDPYGAKIDVPEGAVPRNLAGQEGEMLFTMERGTPTDFGVGSVPPPSGMSSEGDVYEMGPSGFTFNHPVRVTLPLPPGFDPQTHNAMLGRYDPATGKWVVVGGIGESGDEISADVYHLSLYRIFSVPVSTTAWGAVKFNRLGGYSADFCIENYTLKYPEEDGDWFIPPQHTCYVPSLGATGYGNPIRWSLPQGGYTVGVTEYGTLCPSGSCEVLGHYFIEFIIDAPSQYPNYAANEVSWRQPEYLPGRAPCRGAPTPSVGVGSINVRLEWSAYCDLDLWVVDPNGEKIYWWNTSSSSGGQLDLDNYCGDFVMGRPENIYWSSNPPYGTYKIYVDYYEDCGGTGIVSYKVTWLVRGTAYTKSGTISPPTETGADGDESFVAEFTY
jgi:hypothetical protein